MVLFRVFLKDFPQLPLFPSVSKSLESDFGDAAAIFRKHFFKHGFLQNLQLVILTLMKGDKVVEIREISCYFCLFLLVRGYINLDFA